MVFPTEPASWPVRCQETSCSFCLLHDFPWLYSGLSLTVTSSEKPARTTFYEGKLSNSLSCFIFPHIPHDLQKYVQTFSQLPPHPIPSQKVSSTRTRTLSVLLTATPLTPEWYLTHKSACHVFMKWLEGWLDGLGPLFKCLFNVWHSLLNSHSLALVSSPVRQDAGIRPGTSLNV